MNKVKRIIFEFENGNREEITDKQALLFQARVNSAGILSGIGTEETIQLDKIEEEK